MPYITTKANAAFALEELRTGPELSIAKVKRHPLFGAVLAGLATACALFLALLLRESIRSAAASEIGRFKLRKVRNALLLRR